VNGKRAIAAVLAVACVSACFIIAENRRTDRTGRPAPTAVCAADGSRDQDDMCIWVHPTDRAGSTVITADKAANRVFVYDLAGKVLQSVSVRKPGNIDLRYGFPLAGKTVDIVTLNRRSSDAIVVFKVDPATRRIERVDNGKIATGPNYGGTLFRSPKTGKVYFVTTAKGGTCEQVELADDGRGKVKGTKVRTFQTGYSEGAVGDDRAGTIYVAQERKGVWAIGGEPTDPATPKLVIRVGANGLKGDVEGLAIYRRPGGQGYLIVSNQGPSNFKVYHLAAPHTYVGTFTIAGASDTDGIAVTNADLSGRFARGLFACHTNSLRGHKGCPVLLTPWSDIAASVNPQLDVHTAHDSRKDDR